MKKLLLILPILFSFNGWAQLPEIGSDYEECAAIAGIMSENEDDYRNSINQCDWIHIKGFVQVNDDEIDNLLLTAETDYFNLPFFNSEDNNGKPEKDPFETEDEYQLRLEKWVPKTTKNINFILSKRVSASEYNAENESWDHKIWSPESVGYFSRNYEASTYIGSNAFGAEREIVKTNMTRYDKNVC